MGRKIIAVQEGLHEVAELLKSEGFQVTSVDDSSNPIDIIIYSTTDDEYIAHNDTGMINLSSNNKFVRMLNVDEVGINNILSAVEELE
ncbi:YkuS family protein [Alkaliphilus hydrothermalis]|uniref:YkuS family protein n=1 Tax=Alkaliphilus hydrothermalis TaxID=1482730 RepID=A0ABS2NNX5_9FIRM|nr:YkuS family protein [Alkaliphilus hydrothermalis]MBM7614607.1 hypothetical protein [Alkaliphilus hydrothermalis]